MTHRLYPRLAWQGITKNKRLYLPFLLTCVGMVMMTYILLSLASSPVLKTFPGGDVMPMILSMGSFVMAAFAVLFLFYTNSFLIRRRNREFGLYNILGMGKGNLARVLAWESVMMALVAIVGGEALGIALGKLFELVLVNIVGSPVGKKRKGFRQVDHLFRICVFSLIRSKIHRIIRLHQRFFQLVFVLFFQVRLVAVEQIYLFKLSTLNIFINRFHFRLLSNQSVLHQFIM